MKEFKNILLVSGSGRNSGKTTVACEIIRQVKSYNNVYGLKITPHFHKLSKKQIIIEQNQYFSIYYETDESSYKDSSLMLKAGADKVYYIQCTDTHLPKIYAKLRSLIPDKVAIVCESGSFANFYKPGFHLLLVGDDQNEGKASYLSNLKKADIILPCENIKDGNLFSRLKYSGAGWLINKNL